MIRFLVLFCFSLAATAETKFFVLGSGKPNPNKMKTKKSSHSLEIKTV